MKTKLFFLANLFILTAFTNCKDPKAIDSVNNHNESNTTKKIRNICVTCYDPATFVEEHPEIFTNNVLIFDSFDEAISALDSFQNVSWNEKLQLIGEWNIKNDILNSHYKYDSIFSYEENYVMTDDEEYDLLQELSLNPLIQCTQKFVPSHNALCIDEHDQEYYDHIICDSLFYFIEPIWNLDFYALLNEDNIVFLEGFLFKKLTDDNLIMCTPEDYLIGYECTCLTEFQNLGFNIISDNTSIENFEDDSTPTIVVIENTQSNTNNNTNSSNPSRFKEYVAYGKTQHGEYKMEMKLNYNLIYNLFSHSTHLNSHLTIKNYKKGIWTYWLTKFPTSGNLHSSYQFFVMPTIFDIYEYLDLYPGINFMFNSNFSIHTYNRSLDLEDRFFNFQVQYRDFQITSANITNERTRIVISNDQQTYF